MAWLRIEDTVPEHPKHLKAGAAASWLWLCGIAYAQRQLSDGFIPFEAISRLIPGRKTARLVAKLVEVRLFDCVAGGYCIHDYHDYNDTRTEAIAKKNAVKEQRRAAGLASAAARAKQQTGNGAVERPLNPIPSHPIPSQISKENNKLESTAVAATKANGNGNGYHTSTRSKRPIFQGQRFVIFDWMLDDMSQILGPHLDAFDIHTWLDALDQQAVKNAIVKPKGAWWPWVQAELLLEATRRGLPMAEVGLAVSDQTKKNLQAMKGAIARIQGGTA